MSMLCNHCGKSIPNDSIFCPECGQAVVTVTVPTHEITQSEGQQKKNLRPAIIAAVVVVCVALIIGVAVIQNARSDSKAAATEDSLAAADRQAYIQAMNDFLVLSVEGEALAFSACDLTYMVWYDAYFQQYRAETAPYTMDGSSFYSDFNYALYLLYESNVMTNIQEMLASNRAEVKALYTILSSHTEEFSACYALIDEAYTAYCGVMDIAKTPYGLTLDEYATACEEYDSDFSDAVNALYILLAQYTNE